MLLHILDNVIQSAPPYHIATDSDGNPFPDFIGSPFYLVIDVLSNTSAAYDLFRLRKFNAALKDLLDAWGNYLQDPERDSNAVLNMGEEGWFSQLAIAKFERNLCGRTFDETYYSPDPNAENRGYVSWDNFFTRQLRPGARPVDFPENKAFIHSACESTVYRIAYNVNAHDQFWLKAQKYSLYDMLNRDNEKAEYFKGGTIYQAYLGVLDYHRWHSPIDGVIEKVAMIPGTYYASLPDEGAPLDDPDLPAGSPYDVMMRSQAYLTMVATRALIYIRADNPAIGLLCFIGVGMAEVSTCDVTVTEGQTVKIGDEIGMFHYGGSMHTLIFEPNCNVVFTAEASVDKHVWVNSIIGRVDPKDSVKK